jgi:membrane protease YdiL (CAAX protease family)
MATTGASLPTQPFGAALMGRQRGRDGLADRTPPPDPVTAHGEHRGAVMNRRRELPLYFVLAFLLSWLPWPLVALNAGSSPMVPFGPLIAAVIVAALSRTSGPLFAQLRRWRAAPRWYLAAVVVPVAITGLAAGLTIAAGGSAAALPGIDWVQIAAAFGSTVVIVGLFEEVGWRGYALPRLQQRMTSLRAALVLGGIWAI